MRHPRLRPWVLASVGVGLVSMAASCGSTGSSEFGDGGGKDGGGLTDGKSSTDGTIGLGVDSGGGKGDGGCTGLQCQSQKDDCLAKGKPLTSISGVVYDPA